MQTGIDGYMAGWLDKLDWYWFSNKTIGKNGKNGWKKVQK